eukprot:CAMPEP_0197070556 /NCGR_PEP_ID=MMETSP1384-20130603/200970_1 /TAXON_ID=29189 /ORGANISM="Ammonia sp." /LENGTH=343 /DNA_ID=CAMNT_0042508979 /DNA_START=23 /DNA_END=1054 /DNA_ORIENTATION=+
MVQSEFYITVPVTSMSLVLTAFQTLITVILAIHFFQMHATTRQSHHKSTQTESKEEVKSYFKYTALICLAFAALNGLFNSVYCFWLLVDPAFDDAMFYTQHPSHIQRITSTVSWYISKVALLWFFNGRLYYVFRGSVFAVNRKLFIGINVVSTVAAAVCLPSAYICVYAHQLHLAELSFNSFRVLYQILVFTILFMFTRRLLALNVQRRGKAAGETCQAVMVHTNSATQTSSSTGSEPAKASHSSLEEAAEKEEQLFFIHIISRNAVLVFVISVSVLLVTLSFTAFRYVFLPQTRLTLLIPMNMASIDSAITSFCVICMFRFSFDVYPVFCDLCDKVLLRCCA